MPRLFVRTNYSLNNVVTQENAMIFGGVLAACALAAYSFTAFFVAVAVAAIAIAANEIRKNNNSFESQISRFVGSFGA